MTAPTTRPCAPRAGASEAEWQQFVTDCLDLCGFRWYHTHDARRSPGGFPDLIAVKGDRLLVLELKTGRGRIRPGQSEWVTALGQVPGVYAAILRPDDWRLVLELTGVSEMGAVA